MIYYLQHGGLEEIFWSIVTLGVGTLIMCITYEVYTWLRPR